MKYDGENMDAIEFCYWLNGWLELGDIKEANEKQVSIIKEHLALVLTKVTGKEKCKEEIQPDDGLRKIFDRMKHVSQKRIC